MGLNNASSEAAASGTGGWLDAVTYQAGLSGGSWATGTAIVNNYTSPTDLVRNVSMSTAAIFFKHNQGIFLLLPSLRHQSRRIHITLENVELMPQ